MKAQLILLLFLVGTVTTEAYATEAEPRSKVEKTTKSKYDFNIFKLYSFVNQQERPDSLNIKLKSLPLKRKENN